MTSVAYGVNDAGVVVGHSDTMNWTDPWPTGEAFVYDGSTLHFLGTLGGLWSYGMDINNSGYVAGFADTGTNPNSGPGYYTSRYHATIWAPDGTVTDLGTFGNESYAYKINSSGQAVGYSDGNDGFYHGFLYDGTQMIDISLPDQHTMAWSINDAGVVVGDGFYGPEGSAFVYEAGTHYQLATLVNGLNGDTIDSALDINNHGQIVGCGTHNGRTEAFVLTPNGVTVPPPPLPGPINHAPTADAGGPYTITDGDPLTLDAGLSSDPDGDPLSYTWDVNGDGVYGDATGVNPTLSSNSLWALNIGAGTYTVSVRVTDGHGGVDTATTDLTVDLPYYGPEVDLSGPTDGYQGVTNQARTFTITTTDPTTNDFEYFVSWGDGTTDTFGGGATVTASHVYQTEGNYYVFVTATVEASGYSGADSQDLTITHAEMQGDVLAIGGTAEEDNFIVSVPSAGTIETPYGSFTATQITLYGGEATDSLTIRGGEGNDAFAVGPAAVTVNGVTVRGDAFEAWAADGMAGNDTFSLAGGAIPVAVTGGEGNDTFTIGAGGGVAGRVDGGPGTDTLDYSGFAGPVTVNLKTGAATATGGLLGIEGFIGGTQNDTLVGGDGTNNWGVNGFNAGAVNAVLFSSFENLVGGAGADTFAIANARYLTGSIDGKGGLNTLDYSAFVGGVTANLTTGTASAVYGGVRNIGVLIGGRGADNFTGSTGDDLLIGNAGNDVLNGGAGGNDVLVGGAGNDSLRGSATGRNILIGGIGADVLVGGLVEDILIGGTTAYDTNVTSLRSLMAEWKRTDQTYQQRVNHLSGATAGGLSGTAQLRAGKVTDDGTADQLTGLDGLDWFWGLAPELTDRTASERLN